MVVRDQPQHPGCGRVKALRDGFAGVDQHDNLKPGFVGSREAAEVPNDDIAVDDCEVVAIDGLQEMVVLVGGKELDPYFGTACPVRDFGSVILHASPQKTGENSEQNCQ